MRSLNFLFFMLLLPFISSASAQGKHKIEVVALAQHVQRITVFISSPFILNGDKNLSQQVRETIESPALRVETSDLERMNNVVQNLTNDDVISCGSEKLSIDAVVQIEKRGGGKDVFVVANNLLLNTVTKRCFHEPRWIVQVLAL